MRPLLRTLSEQVYYTTGQRRKQGAFGDFLGRGFCEQRLEALNYAFLWRGWDLNPRIGSPCWLQLLPTLQLGMAHSPGVYKGGAATAILNRMKAERAYALDPVICRHCQSPIDVPAETKYSTIRRQKYCSKSCAAKANNHATPKRTRKPQPCESCGKDVVNHHYTTRKYCKECWSARLLEFSERPISEVTKRAICQNARAIMNGSQKQCSYCDYAKHVEVCHLKPIRDFPACATVGEVNAKSNLKYCCPNHHWELDHGMLP